jgi:ligand-binding SRPBCC domain-containing protein
MINQTHTFQSEIVINAPRREVFSFFSKAENLEKLTPNWLQFKILTNLPIEIKKGSLIDYRLKFYGIPIKWKTEITLWDPPSRFIDTQLKGPYRTWIHEHRFIDMNDCTKMIDSVTYQAPGGLFSSIIVKLFVKNSVNKIFDFRSRIIKQTFNHK